MKSEVEIPRDSFYVLSFLHSVMLEVIFLRFKG